MAYQEFNSGSAFLDRARQRSDTVAIRDEARAFTYGHLAQATLLATQHMVHAGAQRDKTVAVRCDDLLALFATLFASALIGCRWVYAGDILLQTKLLEPDLIFDAEPDPKKRIPGALPIDESWGRPPAARESSSVMQLAGHASPDEVWMISPTSGTTGTPKLVGLSPRAVWKRSAVGVHMFDRPRTAITGLFPFGAPAQLSRYLSALMHGGEIVSSVQPETWVKEDVHLVFGSPAQVQTVMGDRVLPRKLPLIHLSGSTAPEKLVRHLLQSFERVSNGYGSTEAHNCLAVYKTLGPDGELQVQTTRRDAEVEIVDEEDRILPRGQEGVVRVRNDRLANGYLDNPTATAAAFRHGCFYPGDIGMWTGDGQFMVTGRLNDQFNLGGVKLNAALLDYALQSVPGIDDAICFMLPRDDGSQSLRAFLTLAPGHYPDTVLAEARVALLRIGGRDAVPERFLFAESLPRNPNGKPDRNACASLVCKARSDRRGAKSQNT